MKMRQAFLALAVLLGGVCASAQETPVWKTQCGTPTGQPKFPLYSYQELPPFVQADPAEWKGVKGLQVSWADKNVRYAKTSVPLSKGVKNLTLKGWRGERVCAQAVIWTGRAVSGLSYALSDLKDAKGHVIPASACETGFLRYVMTDEYGGGCNVHVHTQLDSALLADVVDPYLKSMDMVPMQTQPVWFTLWIPQSAPAGTYKGTVSVCEGGKNVGKLALTVQVEDHVLPAPKDWTFHLDLWQSPFAVARYHQVPLWSPEHFAAMRPLMERLANAGQKVITTAITHWPWNSQTEDPFESMVTWVKKYDGTWTYHYDVFDAWVEFMMSCGITEQINCYSMVPWRLSFRYLDQATDSYQEIHCAPGEPAYEELWLPMLKDFAAHLKAKGWFEKTTIAMDERPMEAMRNTIAVIRKADPGFKLSLAGNYYPEIDADIYDYCVTYRQEFPAEAVARRRAEGKISTMYLCCGPEHPNTFVFSPLEEAGQVGLDMAAFGMDGYLRWAVISWPLEPLLDSRFRTWPGGDTYMLYPGNRTSMRFERFVEGIQEYEKLKILGK